VKVLAGLVAVVVLSGAVQQGWASGIVDPQRLRQSVTHFASNGSRLAGMPGADSAAAYIERTFRQLGLRDVRRESFPVAIPVDEGFELQLPDGDTVPLQGLWPNLVRTPSLPSAGLRGPLIYGGDGALESLEGAAIDSAVVLLEFNSWNRWLDAAMLGAGAVLFIEPDSTSYVQGAQKFLQVPVRTPRFWLSRRHAERLRQLADGRQVVLTGRMTWQQRQAHNILAFLPGTDPALAEQTVLLEAYYDGMSVVPALAPAAEMGVSAAALLEIAAALTADPPARPILFAATSAHHLGLRGMSELLNRHFRLEPHFAERLAEPLPLALAICLDLSSGGDRLGIWNSSPDLYRRRFFAPFGKTFVRLAAAHGPALGYGDGTPLHNGITPVGGVTWQNLVPGGVRSSAELALDAGLPSLALVTVDDARLRVDSPLDLPSAVRYDNLLRQTQLLAVLLRDALNEAQLFPEFRARFVDSLKGVLARVLTFPRRSIAPDRPRPGAVIALRTGSGKSAKGVRETFYAIADESGQAEILGLRGGGARIEAYYLDPTDGEILYAPNKGEQAKIYKSDLTLGWWLTEAAVILFPCVATDFYEAVDPRFLNRLSEMQVYDGTNGTPQEFGYALGIGTDEPVGVLFTRPGERVKMTMSAGLMGLRFALLNATASATRAASRGTGYETIGPGALTQTSWRAARDMWHLNEYRIEEMRRFAISNRRVDQLHAQAATFLQQAEGARDGQHWAEFVRLSRAALGFEARAYPDVTDTQTDVVHGVVFFMALLIPCAFFTERLLFAAADIRRQIAGFALIFVVVWTAISFVHPAFELSSPLVILLAFVILALAVFVLFLVLSRFNASMRDVGTEAVLVHDTDISRLGASYAAFMLGISNMRRRKVRTALTFTTLMLLTFTVLSFTSVQTRLHFSRVERDGGAPYVGGLIRSRTWEALPQSTHDFVLAEFARGASVAKRSWYAPKRKNLIPLVHGDRQVHARGLVGLSPQEQRVSGLHGALVAGQWFTQERESSCLLSVHLAGLLGLVPEDAGRAEVELFGERLLVRGIFDGAAAEGFLDLDGEPLTPVDFTTLGAGVLADQQKQEQLAILEQAPPSTELVSFTHLAARDVIILPYQLVRELGGSLQSVAMRFDDPVGARKRIEGLLARLAVTIFAGLPAEASTTDQARAWTYNSIGVTSLGGLSEQLVPALIASLIVLNTMLGAVYERLREIGIYSSVGLAPLHISFLFIAEACVYAVLGVVAGYLVGQVTAKILIVGGWMGALQLNYSSVAAMGATGLVMAVVVLSSLYPARIAARLAVPDVTRRWEMPEIDGDDLAFRFPFTVSAFEIRSLCVFLVAYLQAYSEESIGSFYTQQTHLQELTPASDTTGYRIDTQIWLAPFDLGVSQDLVLTARPAEAGRRVFEIFLEVHRRSGEPASWHRTNQRFINLLRKQFLIYRTLSASVKQEYGRRGLEEAVA
jgi:hypothetical protein